MVGQTITVSGFPTSVTATEVKEFLARYVDEGSVVAVKLRSAKVSKKRSRALAFVQFSTSKHAEDVSLIAQQRQLIYKTCILTTKSAERDIVQNPRTHLFPLEDAILHLGCPVSAEKFSVQWSCKGVIVDFGFDLRKILFFISSESQSYKLDLSYDSIWEIQLLCPPEKQDKFLLIQGRTVVTMEEEAGKTRRPAASNDDGEGPTTRKTWRLAALIDDGERPALGKTRRLAVSNDDREGLAARKHTTNNMSRYDKIGDDPGRSKKIWED